MNSRGNVMVQVLLMAALLLSLATGLLKMYLQHHSAGVFAMGSTRTRSRVESSLAAAQSAWTANGAALCHGSAELDCGNGFIGGSAGADNTDANNVCAGNTVVCSCRVVVSVDAGATPVDFPRVLVCDLGGRFETRVATEYSMQ